MDLIHQYQELHNRGHFKGYSVIPYAKTIKNIIRQTKSRSLLDYGCGKGHQYSKANLGKYWGIEPVKYDPAVFEFSRKPEGTFDGVICSDVLEHLQENQIPFVIKELYHYADKFLFVSICTREAKKKLPDGRNCHLTIKPRQWWLEQIDLYKTDIRTEIRWNA